MTMVMVYKVGMERDVDEEDEMTIYTRRLLRSASKKNVRKQVQRLIKIKGRKKRARKYSTANNQLYKLFG